MCARLADVSARIPWHAGASLNSSTARLVPAAAQALTRSSCVFPRLVEQNRSPCLPMPSCGAWPAGKALRAGSFLPRAGIEMLALAVSRPALATISSDTTTTGGPGMMRVCLGVLLNRGDLWPEVGSGAARIFSQPEMCPEASDLEESWCFRLHCRRVATAKPGELRSYPNLAGHGQYLTKFDQHRSMWARV